MDEQKRGVLVDELCQRRGELDLVLALGHANGDAIDWLRRLHCLEGDRAALFGGQRRARGQALKLTESHGFAGRCGAALLHFRSHDLEHARNALLAGHAINGSAVRELPGQHPRQRKLARMRGMNGLHDVGGGFCGAQPQAFRRFLDERRLVPQCFQEPAQAIAVLGRSEEDGANLAALEFHHKVGENLVAARHGVAQKLLHQLVVIIGELFEHGEALVGLELRQGGGNLDRFAERVLAIDIGALKRQVHEAAHHVVFPNRYLPQEQRDPARALHHLQDAGQALANLVDLIDK